MFDVCFDFTFVLSYRVYVVSSAFRTPCCDIYTSTPNTSHKSLNCFSLIFLYYRVVVINVPLQGYAEVYVWALDNCCRNIAQYLIRVCKKHTPNEAETLISAATELTELRLDCSLLVMISAIIDIIPIIVLQESFQKSASLLDYRFFFVNGTTLSLHDIEAQKRTSDAYRQQNKVSE